MRQVLLINIDHFSSTGIRLEEQLRKNFTDCTFEVVVLKPLIKNNIRFKVIGDYKPFSKKLINKIKELERRLASILTQGFDDSDTIYGRFKLLDSFEGLLTRPIIQDELEKKHITLIESYKQDVKAVQQIFLENKEIFKENEEIF